MDLTYVSQCGRYTVRVSNPDVKTLFKAIASFQEIFEHNSVVINGKTVPSADIQLRVRKADKYEYYEAVYAGNDPELFGYKLSFGQAESGGLFPKRRDDNGPIPNFGWHKWSPADADNNANANAGVNSNVSNGNRGGRRFP